MKQLFTYNLGWAPSARHALIESTVVTTAICTGLESNHEWPVLCWNGSGFPTVFRILGTSRSKWRIHALPAEVGSSFASWCCCWKWKCFFILIFYFFLSFKFREDLTGSVWAILVKKMDWELSNGQKKKQKNLNDWATVWKGPPKFCPQCMAM